MQCNLIGKARMAPYLPFLQPPPHSVRAYTLCRNNVLSAVSGKYQSLSHSRAFAHAIHLPGTLPPHSPLIKPAHFLSLSVTTMCYMKLALHHAHKAKLATAFSVLPLHFVSITPLPTLYCDDSFTHTHTHFLWEQEHPLEGRGIGRGRRREQFTYFLHSLGIHVFLEDKSWVLFISSNLPFHPTFSPPHTYQF